LAFPAGLPFLDNTPETEKRRGVDGTKANSAKN
jgi:hypothetical protein